MGKKRCPKPRTIPRQDKRICGSICFCQLIVVFSSVSLIYLTVAVYIPSYKTFHSGFETRPVMCQTINTSMINNCSWASCGEWCLTKTSGFCPQIHVTVRRNATNLQLSNCTAFASVSCPQADTASLKRYNCNNGTQCSTLHGLFNCSLGHCTNMSEIFQCHYKADGFTLDSDKENIKMNGFFECRGSRCRKIWRAFHCDRYCDTIYTGDNNVYINMDNTVYASKCSTAHAFTTTDGSEEGEPIFPPRQIWKNKPGEVLMMSCHTVRYNDSSKVINATDCLNGTLYDKDVIPPVSTNFTTFWDLTNKFRELLDKNQSFVPKQSILTIYNHSRLFINLDGCVNTLRGECKAFLLSNGNDGRNQTAQSRFPCFYNQNNSYMVVARYDLNETWRQLVISVSVPSVLFVVSFVTLCVIVHSVRVGDDTKMRCKYCLTKTEDDTDAMMGERLNGPGDQCSSNGRMRSGNGNSKYEVSSPSSDGVAGVETSAATSGLSSSSSYNRKDFTPLMTRA